MGWRDIKAKYERQGGNTQSTEDMVARRILRALSVTGQEALRKAELRYGLRDSLSDDTSLLDRAVAVAGCAVDRFPWPTVREVRSQKAADDVMAELASAEGSRPVLVYRIGDEKEIRAMVWLGPAQCVDISRMPVPCRIRRLDGGFALDCDAGDYFDRIIGKERDSGH